MDLNGRPARGPGKTPRARATEYLRANLIRENGPGNFVQDLDASRGLNAEYKVHHSYVD